MITSRTFERISCSDLVPGIVLCGVVGNVVTIVVVIAIDDQFTNVVYAYDGRIMHTNVSPRNTFMLNAFIV